MIFSEVATSCNSFNPEQHIGSVDVPEERVSIDKRLWLLCLLYRVFTILWKLYRANKGKDILSLPCSLWRCHPDLNWGIKVLQTFALPLGHGTALLFYEKDAQNITFYASLSINGADDEARTRYLHLGKVALYQMSYIRVSRPLSADVVVPPIGIEPMTRGFSVPCSTDWATEANVATRNGLEPSTSSVTG